MMRLCARRLMNPGERDPQFDLQRVGDLGGAVTGGVEAVAPVELGGEVAGGLLPGQGAGGTRVVVVQGVAGGTAEGPGAEGGFGGPALVVAPLHDDLLDVRRPFRVPLDVAHHGEALLRRGGDDHSLGGQFRHKHSFASGLLLVSLSRGTVAVPLPGLGRGGRRSASHVLQCRGQPMCEEVPREALLDPASRGPTHAAPALHFGGQRKIPFPAVR